MVLPLPPLGLGMLSLACTRRRATHHLRTAERYAVQRALCERRCPRRLVLLHKGVYAQLLPASRGSLNRFPKCEALVMLCNAPVIPHPVELLTHARGLAPRRRARRPVMAARGFCIAVGRRSGSPNGRMRAGVSETCGEARRAARTSVALDAVRSVRGEGSYECY